MSGELKPCPFCGGDARLSVDPEGVRDSYGRVWACTVVCDRCAASSGLSTSEEGAAAAWNRRAERTCRPGVANDGCGAWVVYCPECGYTLSGPHASRERAKRYAARRDIMPRYCPNCGGAIVEEVDDDA